MPPTLLDTSARKRGSAWGKPDRTQCERQWNDIAKLRHEQIESGLDIKQRTVLLPLMLALCRNSNRTRVLDVGCGSGHLSRALAPLSEWVDAIDISDVAVTLGEDDSPGVNNLTFHHQPVEHFQAEIPATLVVANMSVMTILDLESALQQIFSNMAPGGRFVFTIPCPKKWAQHLGYFYEPWFEEERAMVVDWAYRLSSMEDSGPVVSHVYRPWKQYVALLREAGFVLEAVHLPSSHLPLDRSCPSAAGDSRLLAVACRRPTEEVA